MAEYRIRLSPEGLGDVEVTVVAKGRAVSLSLRTENETAKGLILNHADELRAELSAQEYQVSGLSVEVGMDSRGGAGFLDAREYAEAASDNGRAAGLRDAAPMQDEIGPQADARRILPKSSTISYRV